MDDGVEMAFLKDEDGQGYSQEIRIPWELLFKVSPEISPGLVFRMGFEFMWGDPTGYTWPIHRYADNMQEGHTSRQFYWTAHRAWGNVTLLEKGQIELRRYVSDEKRVEGVFKFHAELPKSAARVTFVVEDETGHRVRNLAGDILPEDYTVAENGSTRTVEVGWDGLDDKGNLVEPGKYRARGLVHDGLGAEYEMTFYNPGTPPWETAAGNGAWGSDHSDPVSIVSSGDWMIISWGFAEGGSGIIGVGPDRLKKWGEKRGAPLLTADENFIYGMPIGWYINEDVIVKMDKNKGSYIPFVRDGEELPFEYPLEKLFDTDVFKPVGIVADSDSLIILLHEKDSDEISESTLVMIDKKTAEVKNQPVKTGRLTAVAVSPDDALYGTDGKIVYSINTDNGKLKPLPLPGLAAVSAIAVDQQGNIVVADAGPDRQIKIYTTEGKQIGTCGKRGGRAIRGEFDRDAIGEVSSVAADSKGQIWVVEKGSLPRRVSVWNPEGGLVHDYIGNTAYAGTRCYLHDSDPSVAYVGPIELKLDKANRSWEVSRILWNPDPDVEGECFYIGPGGNSFSIGEFAHPQRFSAEVNGKLNEYMFVPPYRDFEGYKFFMETENGWQPVSAVTTVGQISGSVDRKSRKTIEEPSGEFAGLHPFDAVIWNDTNGDGRVQFDECDIIKLDKPRKGPAEIEVPIPMGSGWGGACYTGFCILCRRDLSLPPDRLQ